MSAEVATAYKILSIVATTIASFGTTYFFYDKSRKQDKIDKIENSLNEVQKQQTEHENKFITDQRTRDIVREEITPMREDVSYIKRTLPAIESSVVELTKELAIRNAVDLERQRLTESNKGQ